MAGLRRSEAGRKALDARFYAGVWARIGQEQAAKKLKERTMTNGTNGTTTLREKVEFPPNETVRLALRFAQPKIGTGRSGEDYAMYTTVDNRIMFLDPEVARQITQAGIRPAEEFCMRMRWSGKKTDPRIYEVWKDGAAAPPPAYGAQRDGTYHVPASPAPPAQAESDLEYELRMSVEVERIKREIAARKTKRTAGNTSTATPAAPVHATPPAKTETQHFATREDSTPMNGKGETRLQIANALAKDLVGLFVDVRAWTREEYGTDVSDEIVRCLCTSAFIETGRVR
jgi:hypothetical protein